MKIVFGFILFVCVMSRFCLPGNPSGTTFEAKMLNANGAKLLRTLFSLCAKRRFCRYGPASNVCPTPNNPININVHGKDGEKGEKGEKGDSAAPCKCNLQDPKKPSAHIEAARKFSVTYQKFKVIKDWSISAPYSHLAGGMKYHDGKLTVPTSGRYYIYAQVYYGSRGRVIIRVNGNRVSMTQPPTSNKDYGTLYAGGVFNLKAGDAISLGTEPYGNTNPLIYMDSQCSYFGAFLI